jgi:hypothetical protein
MSKMEYVVKNEIKKQLTGYRPTVLRFIAKIK